MSLDAAGGDFWDGLPRIGRGLLHLERRVDGWLASERTRSAFMWLDGDWATAVEFDRPEVEARPSALFRPALVAQVRWPRLGTRLAIGVEIPIVHAVVDRLLGFDRPFADGRLQTTPVEWGVWTYLVVRVLQTVHDAGASPFRFGGRPEDDAFDVSVDRVGPSPFDAEGLGEVLTVRWAVKVGEVAGAVRLWLPANLASYWVEPSADERPRKPVPPAAVESSSDWSARIGTTPMPLGLGRLRVGAVLPIGDSKLEGTPNEPAGSLDLVCIGEDRSEYRIAVEPAPGTSGRSVRVSGALTRRPPNPEDRRMSSDANPATPIVDPMDAPVTLAVEMGRLTIPLSRLADLKPGDVLDLNRRSREPVEITSNGRVVARGDLLLIDSELGVRVTSVLL